MEKSYFFPAPSFQFFDNRFRSSLSLSLFSPGVICSDLILPSKFVSVSTQEVKNDNHISIRVSSSMSVLLYYLVVVYISCTRSTTDFKILNLSTFLFKCISNHTFFTEVQDFMQRTLNSASF